MFQEKTAPSPNTSLVQLLIDFARLECGPESARCWRLPDISRVSIPKALIRGPSDGLVCMRKGTWHSPASLLKFQANLLACDIYNFPALVSGSTLSFFDTSDWCAESHTPLLDLVQTQLLFGSLIHLLSLVVIFDPLAPLSVSLLIDCVYENLGRCR